MERRDFPEERGMTKTAVASVPLVLLALLFNLPASATTRVDAMTFAVHWTYGELASRSSINCRISPFACVCQPALMRPGR